MSTKAPLLNFEKSGLRKKLFLYFFTNPDRKHYLRQIADMLKVDPTNLSRELKRLEAEGVFLSETSGHQKYFFLNQRYQLHDELKSAVQKTIGVPEAIKGILTNVPGIKRAFIYGSFAKGTEAVHSDIDVCLIIHNASFKEGAVQDGFKGLEGQLGREISYAYFTEEEWERKRRNKESFVLGLLNGKRIELIQ